MAEKVVESEGRTIAGSLGVEGETESDAPSMTLNVQDIDA